MSAIPGSKPQKKMKPINWGKSLEGSLFPLHETSFFLLKKESSLFIQYRNRKQREAQTPCCKLCASQLQHSPRSRTSGSPDWEVASFSLVLDQLTAPLAFLSQRNFCVCFSLFLHQSTLYPHYSCVCKFPCSLKYICNCESRAPSPFPGVPGHAQSNKKLASPDAHAPGEVQR